MEVSASTAPLIAGFSGGVASTTLLLPLDVIKVRLQVYEGGSKRGSSRSSSNDGFAASTKKNAVKPRRSMNSFRILGGILKYEGARGLYVGWTPAVVGSAVSWGGYFYFYEGLKRKLLDYKKTKHLKSATSTAGFSTDQSIASSNASTATTPPTAPTTPALDSLDYFILSCTSGAIMVTMTNPIWLVKTRMQLQMKRACSSSTAAAATVKPYKNTFDAFATIIRQEGFLALYRGAGAAFLLTSHGGVQFVVYEFLRKHYHFQRASSKVSQNHSNGTTAATTTRSVWERLELSSGYLTMGAVAKIVASTTTYPLQVVKARMQQRSQAVEVTPEGELQTVRRDGYNSLAQTVRRVYQTEGVWGFFKGCVPNAVRVAPGAAITFVVYEEVMDWLSNTR